LRKIYDKHLLIVSELIAYALSRDTVVSRANSRVARDEPCIFTRDQKLRRTEIIRSQ